VDAHKVGRFAQRVPDHIEPVGLSQLLGLVPFIRGKPYRLSPQESLDFDSFDEDLPSGFIGDLVDADIKTELQVTDPLDAVYGETLSDERFDDPVFCGDLALMADGGIEFIDQIGELRLCLGVQSQDDRRAHMFDRSRASDPEPFESAETFLTGALKLGYIFHRLVCG
jgi:hypothetical protein